MMKLFYNSSDVRKLKEQSVTMFEEVSDGVYYVLKDRTGDYFGYTTASDVVKALNNEDKVAVTNIKRVAAYANFDIE